MLYKIPPLLHIFFSILFIVGLAGCNSSSSSTTLNASSTTDIRKIPGIEHLNLELLSNIIDYENGNVSLEVLVINIGYINTATAKTSHSLISLSPLKAYYPSNNEIMVNNLDYSTYVISHDVRVLPDATYVWYSYVNSITPNGIDPTASNETWGGFRLKNGLVIDRCEQQLSVKNQQVDPYGSYLWHIENTGQSTHTEKTGVAGADLSITSNSIKIARAGEGIIVAVVDDGGEICHPDLKANVIVNGSVNFVNNSTDTFHVNARDSHGTEMAGIIASEKDNGLGGYGIAYHAKLKFFNFLKEQNDANFSNALGSSTSAYDVDIFNQSFGRGGYTLSESNISEADLSDYEYGVNQLRNGLGAIYVKSAGNYFNYCFADTILSSLQDQIGCLNANIDQTHHIPYQIVISAFNANNVKSSYSSVGSVLWVSAPGGEDGKIDPALLSTDAQTCQAGYNLKLVLEGEKEYYDGEGVDDDACDYTQSANGTSAAASGSIALLLATPNANGSTNSLTWRDVKHILARSARKLDANQDNVSYDINGDNMIAQYAWQKNSASYWYHNWYGFGAIDVARASSMVQNYIPNSLGTFSSTEWKIKNSNLTIPDYDANGIIDNLNISGINGNIEAVIVSVNITHPITHDLHIELISPSGAKSIVHTLFNRNFASNKNFADWHLLTNAFYGETINGDWKIRVIDGMKKDVGILNRWALKFYYGQHSY